VAGFGVGVQKDHRLALASDQIVKSNSVASAPAIFDGVHVISRDSCLKW
jgi:hypothetical protein